MHTFVTLPMLCPLSSSLHNDLTTSRLLLLQYLHSSSPRCWLGFFVEKSSTAFFVLDHLLQYFFFIFPLHVFQPFISFLHGVLPSCVGPCFLTIFRKHLRDPPPVLGIHVSFRSNFLFQIFHDGHPLLLLDLLLFCLLLLLALQSLQIVFSERGEKSRPTTPPTFLISVFLASSHSFPFQWVASAFEGSSLALFDFALVQDFLFHSFS